MSDLRTLLDNRFLAPEGTPWEDVEGYEADIYAAFDALVARVERAEARAAKAEAVVEAMRDFANPESIVYTHSRLTPDEFARRALTAYDEPPTEQAT